tara:strand:+ start:744 stop:848 length:105 start_codon:yes stop_codon:yes gene_type:complete
MFEILIMMGAPLLGGLFSWFFVKTIWKDDYDRED